MKAMNRGSWFGVGATTFSGGRLPGIWRLLVAALFVALLPQRAEAQGTRVELELVLAIDTSTSVDEVEYDLQRSGLAKAFRDPEVLAAIASLGKSGMAVTVVQWAGVGDQVRATDWHHIRGLADAEHFAKALAQMPRRLKGFTDIAGAIEFSTRELLENRFRGARLAIDVSGDGTSDAEDPAIYRDLAVGQGITINALVIFSNEHDLGDLARFDLQAHFITKVIGGPGAFMLTAHHYRNFAEGIRKKLIREIIGVSMAQLDKQ